MCGDSTNKSHVEKLMDGAVANMIFTDPPYNVKINNIVNLGKTQHAEFAMASGEMNKEEFISFLSACFANLIEFSGNGSIHFICMDWKHIQEITTAGELYTELKNLCIWNKDNGGMGSFYRSKHELVFVYKNGNEAHINNFELGQHGQYRTNVWDYAGVNSFSTRERVGNKSTGKSDLSMHPTVKPVKLVGDAILDCSVIGNIILDLFGGSGTTMLAAEQLGRIGYLMEITPKYCNTIINRMLEYNSELVLKINGKIIV
jgi:DNA modification methylase